MAENGILDYQGMNQAIYRGATSNIVVDTQSMSIEIGAGNSSHTSNLHIECDHDANVASIQLNSNVVTEFPRSKKLIKYPRVAMTGQTTSNHTITGSSWFGSSALGGSGTEYFPWKAFDNVGNHPSGQLAWYSFDYSGTEAYSGTGNVFNPNHGGTATPDLFTGAIQGEWLKIQLPDKIALDHYIMYGPNGENEFPRDWTVYGSVDGTNWSWIDSRIAQIFGDGTGGAGTGTGKRKEFYLDTPTNEYLYFGFVFTRGSVNRTQYIGIGELELYGTPEYDPEAHGTDVTVKSKTNVPNTDWLEVYFDAKGLSNEAVTDPISGLGGTTINGTATNVTVSDGAFVFDGSSSYVTGGTPSMSGNHPHSYSCWLKPTAANSGYKCIGYFINEAVQPANRANTTTGLFLNNNRPVFLTWGNNLISDHTLAQNEWVHITAVYDGMGRTIYVNCKQIDSDTYSSYNINASATLLVGASTTTPGEVFGGSIANFRVFNRALTTDEIYQLYAYQKQDFGHSTNNMTLKAGRLGIGTSEPRAALDVRGMLNISDKIESPFFKVFSIFDKADPTVDHSHWSSSVEGIIRANSTVIVTVNVGGYRSTTGNGTFNIQYRKAGTTGFLGLSDIFLYFNHINTHVYRNRTFVWKPTVDIHFVEWKITFDHNCNGDDKADLVLVSLPV